MNLFSVPLPPSHRPTAEELQAAIQHDASDLSFMRSTAAIHGRLPPWPRITGNAPHLLRLAYLAGQPAPRITAAPLRDALVDRYGVLHTGSFAALACFLTTDTEAPSLEQVLSMLERFPELRKHWDRARMPKSTTKQDEQVYFSNGGRWPSMTPLHLVFRPLAEWLWTPIRDEFGEGMPDVLPSVVGDFMLAKLDALFWQPPLQAEVAYRKAAQPST